MSQINPLDYLRQRESEMLEPCGVRFLKYAQATKKDVRQYYEGFAYRPSKDYAAQFIYRPPSAATLASPKAQMAYQIINQPWIDNLSKELAKPSQITNDQWILNLRQPKTTKCPVTGSVTTTFDINRFNMVNRAYFKLTPTPQEVPMNTIPKNCYVLICLSNDSPRLLYPKMRDSGDVQFGTYADELEGDFVFDRDDISSDCLRPLAAKYRAVFICKLADVVRFEMKSLTKE